MGEIINPIEELHRPEKIVADTQWEDFPRIRVPFAGAIAHWGTEHDNGAVSELLASHGIQAAPEEIARTGFTSRYLYPPGVDMRMAGSIEEAVGTQLIQRACANYGIEPADLSMIAIANSFPYHPHSPIKSFAQQIAAWSGVPEDVPFLDAQLLCNGGLEAMRRLALRSEELKGKYVAVASMEGLGKTLDDSRIGAGVDPANLQIFTNAGAAIVWEMGEDICFPQIGDFESGSDEYRAIIGPQLFPFSSDVQPGDVCTTETSIRQKIFAPNDGGDYGSMSPGATLRWFTKVVKPSFIQALKKHFPHPDGNQIPYIGHVPSAIIHAKLIEHAMERGYDLHAPVFVRDGNGSSAVALMQMLRAGADGFFDEGRETLVYGYGLGWNSSSFTMHVPQKRQ